MDITQQKSTLAEMQRIATGVVPHFMPFTKFRLSTGHRLAAISDNSLLIDTANAPIFGVDKDGKVSADSCLRSRAYLVLLDRTIGFEGLGRSKVQAWQVNEWNKKLVDISGYSRSECLGHNLVPLLFSTCCWPFY
jgi:hypothetical protein